MNELKQGTSLQGGKYIIKRVLGQGGFGITYLAEQVSLGREVAIKEFFMKDGCMRDGQTGRVLVPPTGSALQVEQYRKKFLKEARMIASFRHPHIVNVIDVFEENGTAYYVMPYMEYGSLKSIVERNGRLPEADALHYIGQIADALRYMHKEKRSCHYDVKPDNIMVDYSRNAVLIDFGISKNYDADGNETSTTPIGLSEGYAPIEQYQGISGFSPASDVYALGATLYYLLVGQTPPSAVDRVQGKELMLPKDISKQTRLLIEQSMVLQQSQRPTDIHIFKKQKKGKQKASEETINNPKDTEATQEQASFQSSESNKSQSTKKEEQLHRSLFKKLDKRNYWIAAALTFLAVIVLVVFTKTNDSGGGGIIGENHDMEVLNSIEMVLVKSGAFVMGRSDGGEWNQRHPVTLSDFYIGKTEVTQAQWVAVMGSNPSKFKGDDLPVENVTWQEVHIFINKLNELTGKNYRLPTEAEWEFAAGGGNKGNGFIYSGSNTLDEVAWYEQNSNMTTHSVGSKLPNSLGIYDMSGNVNEWCSDLYLTYPKEPQLDPKGGVNDHPENRHIIRGGGWKDTQYSCEITERTDGGDNQKHHEALGFRLAMDGDTDNSQQSLTDASVYSDKDEKAFDGERAGHKWIDLGLPSGLKWATCNVGASSPKDIGKYFAWGETKTRESYTEKNRIYYSYKNLNAAHDVATQVMGKGWRLPTKSDFDELASHCKCQNAGDGVVLVGSNGHKIYIPFSGKKYESSLDDSFPSSYWSSTPVISNDEYFKESVATTLDVFFDKVEINQMAVFHGLNVRAVTN